MRARHGSDNGSMCEGAIDESTRTRPPMHVRAWKEAKKEEQQAKEAKGQTTIKQAFKKVKK